MPGKRRTKPMSAGSKGKAASWERRRTDLDGGTVSLLAVDALDVDDPLLAVNLGDLALTPLVGTTNDEDLVVLADGDAPGLFCPSTKAQREVSSLARNIPRASNTTSGLRTLYFSRSSLLRELVMR